MTLQNFPIRFPFSGVKIRANKNFCLQSQRSSYAYAKTNHSLCHSKNQVLPKQRMS